MVQLARGEGEPAPGECVAEEHWLVRATRPAEVRLVLALCNDGYGASGAGSAWRWSSVREFQLSPPRPLSQASSSFHTMNRAVADR